MGGVEASWEWGEGRAPEGALLPDGMRWAEREGRALKGHCSRMGSFLWTKRVCRAIIFFIGGACGGRTCCWLEEISTDAAGIILYGGK